MLKHLLKSKNNFFNLTPFGVPVQMKIKNRHGVIVLSSKVFFEKEFLPQSIRNFVLHRSLSHVTNKFTYYIIKNNIVYLCREIFPESIRVGIKKFVIDSLKSSLLLQQIANDDLEPIYL